MEYDTVEESPYQPGPSTHASSQLNRLQRSYTEVDWEAKKHTIKYLYIDQDMPLEDVVDTLSKEYSFHTNVRMCKTRLKRWEFTKNSSKNRKSTFRYDRRSRKSSGVMLERTAKRLNGQRIRRSQKHASAALNSILDMIPEVDSHESINLGRLEPLESLHSVRVPSNHSIHSLNIGLNASESEIRVDEPLETKDTNTSPVSAAIGITNAECDGLSEGPRYDGRCPYRKGGKKFRLIQCFDLGARFQSDFLSDDTLIALDNKKSCPIDCACQKYHYPSTFAFTVQLYSDSMTITFHSEALWDEVLSVLPAESRPDPKDKIIDGLVLLKNLYCLKHLLRMAFSHVVKNTSFLPTFVEIKLLVYGFLGNGNNYASLGYEHAYEDGYLDYHTWKTLSAHKLQLSIGRLNEAFWDVDKEETNSTEYKMLRTSEVIDIDDHCEAQRLHRAAKFGDTALVSRLLEHGENIDAACSASRTPLFYAAEGGHLDVVRLLCHRGANFDGEAGEYFTPLYAAAKSGHCEVVKWLLDHAATVRRMKYMDLGPALYIAAANGHRDMVSMLLNYSSICYSRTRMCDHQWQFMTQRIYYDRDLLSHPIQAAASNGHYEVLELLLDDEENGTCEELNERENCYECSDITWRERAVVAWERDQGLPWGMGHVRERALIQAAMSMHLKCVVVLLGYGVEITPPVMRALRGLPLLIFTAIEMGREKAVKALLRADANVTVYNHEIGTALSVAVASNDDSITRLLLDHSTGQVPAAFEHFRANGDHCNMLKLMEIARRTMWNRCERRRMRFSQGISAPVHSSISYLRKRFIRQYEKMIAVSSVSSTKLHRLGEQLVDYRQSWAVGISTMRQLCQGKQSTSVEETIPFLGLAAAMVETLRDVHYKDYMDEFLADLPRWRMLFHSPDKIADLDAYTEAAKAIWSVDVTLTLASNDEPADLLRFQSLASTLASRIDVLFEDDPGKDPPEADIDLDDAKDGSYAPSRSSLEVDAVMTQNNSITAEEKAESSETTSFNCDVRILKASLTDQISADVVVIDPVATLIIAGAIFAVTIIFFQVMRKLAKLTSLLRVSCPSIRTLAQRYLVLESEMIKKPNLVLVEGVCGTHYCVI